MDFLQTDYAGKKMYYCKLKIAVLKEDIFGHVYLFSLLHIEICEIILTIGIKTPS